MSSSISRTCFGVGDDEDVIITDLECLEVIHGAWEDVMEERHALVLIDVILTHILRLHLIEHTLNWKKSIFCRTLSYCKELTLPRIVKYVF